MCEITVARIMIIVVQKVMDPMSITVPAGGALRSTTAAVRVPVDSNGYVSTSNMDYSYGIQ